MTLKTLHLGSREPKRYCAEHELPKGEFDPGHPVLHPDQPGAVKCRIKFRLSPQSSLQQTLAEVRNVWAALDHGEKPAWVSGTDDFTVRVVAESFGGVPIRAWEPAEGDE